MKSIFKTFLLYLMVIAQVHFAFAQQTQSIIPPAFTTYFDQNGKPLSSGNVQYYVPGTTVAKTTFQDDAGTTPNTNPVVLDAAGKALAWGTGCYRQIVQDKNNNQIWDQTSCAGGSGSSTGPTSTGDGDLVGTIKPWAGPVAPNQYMFTFGQQVSRTTFAVLYTAITSSQAIFCTLGSPILTGLGDTTNFWIGMTVEVPCVAAGQSTIISKTSTTVTLAVNSVETTNTTAIFYMWGNGDGATTFTIPDFRGLLPMGNNNMGGVASSNITTTNFGAANPNSSGALGGNQTALLSQPNLPNNTLTTTSTGNITTSGTVIVGASLNSVQGGSTQGSISTGGTITNVNTFNVSTTGSTSSINGNVTQTSFSIIQPSKTVNYIIKVTPDANSSTASGVTSLGGMTGSIACGAGLLCTGNNISVVGTTITINSSSIIGGTTGRVLYDNAGTIGEYTSVPINEGGTGQITATSAISALMPTPTRAGDVAYWNGTNWVTLAGNNSTSGCFGENSSGTPSWTTCSGGSGAIITSVVSVTGSTTTYTSGQANELVSRSNSGAAMVDTLPGTSPGILPATTIITIKNNDTSGVLAINVGSGATLKAQVAPTGYLYICPNQSVSFFSDGSTYWAFGQPPTCYLKASTSFFAAASGGSATNHGLTSASPLNSINATYNLVQSTFNASLLNPSSQIITIQAGTPGTSGQSFAAVLLQNNVPGQGVTDTQLGLFPVVIQGDTTTPANITITGGGTIDAFVGEGSASVLVQGFAITAPTIGNGIAANGGKIAFKTIIFGPCGTNHVLATHRGFVEIAGNYTLNNGPAQGHWQVSDGGAIYVQAATAINITGSSPLSSCWACAQYPSAIVLNVVPTFTGAGTIGGTGTKYNATFNGIINTGGQGASFFPGTNPGATSTGGQYG